MAQRFAGPNGSNRTFSQEEIEAWSTNPEEYLKYRKEIEDELNMRFRLYVDHSTSQKAARTFSVDQMTERLSSKPELANQLIPDFPVG